MNVPVILMPTAGDENTIQQKLPDEVGRGISRDSVAWAADGSAETLRITSKCAALVRYEFATDVTTVRLLQCVGKMMVLAFILNRSLQWQTVSGVSSQLSKRRCYALTLGSGKSYILRLNPGISRICLLYCTADYAAELASELPALKYAGYSTQCDWRPVPADGAEIHAALWQHVIRLQQFRDEGAAREAHLHAQVLQIFSEFINAVEMAYGRNARSANISIATLERVLIAKKIIDDSRLPERLPLRAVAMDAGLTIRHLQQCFRNLFGTTVDKYQREVKLQKAAAMLINHPQLSVYQVGLRNGFNDESSFIRAFKRVLGVTPSQYRRINN